MGAKNPSPGFEAIKVSTLLLPSLESKKETRDLFFLDTALMPTSLL